MFAWGACVRVGADGDEYIEDEMHEYYYVPTEYGDDGSAEDDNDGGNPYGQVDGSASIQDNYADRFDVLDDGDEDGPEPVDPGEVGLIGDANGEDASPPT